MSKLRWMLGVPLILTVLAMIGLILTIDIRVADWSRLASRLWSPWTGLLVVLFLAQQLFRTVRLGGMLPHSIRTDRLLAVVLIHQACAQLLPFHSGELTLPELLARQQVRRADTLATLVLLRLCDFIVALILLLGFSLLLTSGPLALATGFPATPPPNSVAAQSETDQTSLNQQHAFAGTPAVAFACGPAGAAAGGTESHVADIGRDSIVHKHSENVIRTAANGTDANGTDASDGVASDMDASHPDTADTDVSMTDVSVEHTQGVDLSHARACSTDASGGARNDDASRIASRNFAANCFTANCVAANCVAARNVAATRIAACIEEIREDETGSGLHSTDNVDVAKYSLDERGHANSSLSSSLIYSSLTLVAAAQELEWQTRLLRTASFQPAYLHMELSQGSAASFVGFPTSTITDKFFRLQTIGSWVILGLMTGLAWCVWRFRPGPQFGKDWTTGRTELFARLPQPFLQRLTESYQRFLRQLFSRPPTQLGRAFGWTFPVGLTGVAFSWLFCCQVVPEVDARLHLFAVLMMPLLAQIPLRGVAGLGTNEAYLVMLYSSAGLEASVALALAICGRTFHVSLFLLSGTMAACWLGLTRQSKDESLNECSETDPRHAESYGCSARPDVVLKPVTANTQDLTGSAEMSPTTGTQMAHDLTRSTQHNDVTGDVGTAALIGQVRFSHPVEQRSSDRALPPRPLTPSPESIAFPEIQGLRQPPDFEPVAAGSQPSRCRARDATASTSVSFPDLSPDFPSPEAFRSSAHDVRDLSL